jgi:hypothetical protein
MSTIEERARAAMRAIAATVDDAPPLVLTPAATVDDAGPLPLPPAADPATGPDRTPAPDEVRATPHGGGEPGVRERDTLRRPRGASGPDTGRRDTGRRDTGRPAGRGWSHRHWSLLAPIAAVIAIVAVATTLAVIRNVPNTPVAVPSGTASAAGTSPVTSAASGATVPPGLAGVPEYYAAWMQAEKPYLIVGDTLTGKTLGTFSAPDGVSFSGGVYGTSSDDRTFIVTGTRLSGSQKGTTVWYLLRILAGAEGGPPLELETLQIPVRQSPAGVALSPDGTEVAVAVGGRPATLRVYSVATGALLRQWSTTATGKLTAQAADAGSWPLTASVLRWSPDGRQLAFAWNAAAIRVLNASGPGGDLITASKQIAAIGTTYGTLSSLTCDAAAGWNLLAGGQKVVCAGSEQTGKPPGDIAGGWTCPSGDRVSVGFVWEETTSNGGGGFGIGVSEPECPGQVAAPDAYGPHIGWTSANGTEIIGLLLWQGHQRFGVFDGGKYTPLPALPNSWGDPAIVLNGAEAF